MITFIPAPNYDATETGVINMGRGVSFDVGAALQSGGGSITVDETINPSLVASLRSFPGLVVSGTPVGTPIHADILTPVLAHSNRPDGTPSQSGDLLTRQGDGTYRPGDSSGGQFNQMPKGERSIVVTNQFTDPRCTTPANWSAQLLGTGGSVTENPTNVADGYQQFKNPPNALEVVVVPGSNGFQVYTSMAANGHTMQVQQTRPMIAARVAAKISGNIGNAWKAQLNVNYYQQNGTYLGSVTIATAGPNQAQPGNWFVLEGFDAQLGLTFANAFYCELGLVISGTTGGNPGTLRWTEVVVALDQDGDVPSYVGGDIANGNWWGAADNSLSTAQFHPNDVYPKTGFGYNQFELTNTWASGASVQPFSIDQCIAMHKVTGSDITRLNVNLVGGAPPSTTPAPNTNTIALAQALIAAGIKPVLNFASTPSWMSPTHLGLVQNGNGGNINATATAVNVTGALPTNFPALPQTVKWNDGTAEVATLTALSGGVATLTRGAGAVLHADGVQLVDANFGQFGHVYYPDATYRQVFAQAVVNVIDQLGGSNIAGILFGNEPNFGITDTRAEGPVGYTALFNVMHDAVKAKYPNIPLYAGTLAASLGSSPGASNTDPVTFLNGMFTAGIKCDGIDCHFYPGTQRGATYTPSSAPDWGQPASVYVGFDAGIKRIKDALAANGQSGFPISVSEFGIVNNVFNEKTQAQASALMLGRMKRDPQIVFTFNNGICGLYVGGAGLTSVFDRHQLRPKAVARQFAKMQGVPPIPFMDDLVRWPGVNSGLLYEVIPRDEPQAFIDAIMPWTIQMMGGFANSVGFGDIYVVSGAWRPVGASGSGPSAMLSYNSSNAQNDEAGFQLPLAKGLWTLSIWIQQGAGNADVTVNLDGSSQGVLPGYAAATGYAEKSLSFYVPTSGNHNLTLKAATRNASNTTGWTIAFNSLQMRRLS